MCKKNILMIATLIFSFVFYGLNLYPLTAASITEITSDKTIPDNTTISSTDDFKKAIDIACRTLQDVIVLKAQSSSLNAYSTILKQYNGLISYTLNCVSKGSDHTLTVKLNFKQAFKLSQALKNDIAYNKLNDADKKLLDHAKGIVAKITKPEMSDYDKELAIHDYIINNTSYDYNNLKNNSIPDSSYTAAGVFNNHIAVCQGYSEAFNLLLNIVGIENVIVNGKTADGGHAWNAVKIDNEWYMTDITFDDPITFKNNKRQEVLSYEYFNVTNTKLSQDHSWSITNYPVATGTKNNYYVHNQLVANNYTDFKNIINKQLSEGKKELLCYVKDSKSKSYDLSFLYKYSKNISYSLPSADKQEGTISISLL